MASVRQTAKARESARDIAWSRTRTLRFDLVTIDHGAAEFPYLQLAGILRERIRTGQYPAGRQIPAFVALEQEFTLSGMTVRRAVNVLAAEGLVEKIPGRGTFVKRG